MKHNVLVICGPTASGKTALAVALAQKFGGEVAGETGVFFNGRITPVVLKRENLPARFQPAMRADT